MPSKDVNGGSTEHRAADADHPITTDGTADPTNCETCGLAVNALATHHFPATVDEV
jgi:hypothetical protein